MPFLDRIIGSFAGINRTTTTQGATPEEPRTIGAGESRRVIGHTGTAAYGGYIIERERNARLTGIEKYRTFSETLANTSIVAAGVRFFLNLVAKAQWNIEPAQDIMRAPRAASDGPTEAEQAEQVATSSANAVEIAEAIDDILNGMSTPWPRVVRRAAMYRLYGYSVQEWTAKRREDGLIGLLDVAPRPQVTIERWDLDVTGRVIGAIQRSEQTSEEIYLPRNKLVYAVDDSLNDSPEGLGLFRHIVEPVQRLRRYEQLEGFSYEADLRGIPVGRAPLADLEAEVQAGRLSQAQKQAMEKGLEDFISKHIKNPALGIILDSTPYRSLDEDATPSSTAKWDVSLLESAGNQGQEAILRAIERVTREIARVLGVEHLLLGEGDRGSMALSRDKSNNFALIVDSTLAELVEVFEKDLIGPLMRMNGWPMELRPTLKTEAIQYRDIEQLTSAIRDMSQAGVTIDRQDDAVGELFDLMGLSRPDPMAAEMQLLRDRQAAAEMMGG